MRLRGLLLRHAVAWLLPGLLAAAACAAAATANALDAGSAPAADNASTVPASAAIVQGGIVTLPVAGAGAEDSDAGFELLGPVQLSAGSDDPDAAAYAGRIGYEFTNMGAGGGNLTLFVGAAVPVGSYALAVAREGHATAASIAFTLRVLPKGHVYVTDPRAGYQQALDRLQPGDVLELRAGTYPGNAVLSVGGTRERPITVRGYGHGEPPPVIQYAGAEANAWEIRTSNLIVEGLAFDSVHTDPIRIRKPASGTIDNVTIVGNTFVDCGGICVTANDPGTSYAHIRILSNLVLAAHRTGFYIGSQDGRTPASGFLFEGNVVDLRLVNDPKVEGYGIETKLNVRDATLRNNYILGAQGPGIMTYGLQAGSDPARASVVERNIVIGSCTDQNIVTGAGPASVRGNLAVGGHHYGYGIQDYHQWHRLADVRYLDNTSLLNRLGGFWSDPDPKVSGVANLRMAGNRAYPAVGRPGFVNLPPDVPPAAIIDNLEVAPTAAMADAAARLQTLVPSPRDLRRHVWPLLAGAGPLSPARLQDVLRALTALPDQSRNAAARTCN